MRRHVLLLVSVMLASTTGCASSAKLRAATTATYHAAPNALLAVAMQAVEDREYEIVDRGSLAFAAVPVNYLAGPNGRDNVLSTAYVVRLVPADDGFHVTIEPQDYLYGRGLTQNLTRLDGNVDDRLNTLTLAIYEDAKPFAR